MGLAQTEEKAAVTSGYWNLFRFDPRKKGTTENPFSLDSKAPTESYRDFLMSEVRYSSLARTNPDRADMLFSISEKDAKDRYEHLTRLSALYSEEV